MNRITLSEYSPEWPKFFEELREVYTECLEGVLFDVLHVGSTSVRGLAAKPIIDIDLVIESRDRLDEAIKILGRLGYEYRGDLGIKDREAFKQTGEDVPRTKAGRKWPRHNLYVCIKGALCIRNHLAFRDFLRNNPQKAKEYADLKKRLASEDPFGIDTYCMKKTPFILEVLRNTGFLEKDLEDIMLQNRVMKRL